METPVHSRRWSSQRSTQQECWRSKHPLTRILLPLHPLPPPTPSLRTRFVIWCQLSSHTRLILPCMLLLRHSFFTINLSFIIISSILVLSSSLLSFFFQVISSFFLWLYVLHSYSILIGVFHCVFFSTLSYVSCISVPLRVLLLFSLRAYWRCGVLERSDVYLSDLIVTPLSLHCHLVVT